MTITISGVRKAYRELKKRSTRMIVFPDGLARSITLENRQWRIYDAESNHPRYWKTSIEELVFKDVQIRCRLADPPEDYPLRMISYHAPEDFERFLRECFKANLRACLALREERDAGVSNTNRK